MVKGVPEGWEIKASYDVLNVMGGGTPKTGNATYWNGNIPIFTPKDAPSGFYCLGTEKQITDSGLKSCNSSLYRANKTIFITARGTVGKLAIPYKDMAMNQSCYALTSDHYIYFYFLSLKNKINIIKGISQSGVFDNIVTDTFKILKLMIPKEEVLIGFDKQVTPLFENVGTLLQANKNLTKTRDVLLPRLISGKLSVENLNIQFPPSMEEIIT
jgi:type I restriction enzyme S subunit